MKKRTHLIAFPLLAFCGGMVWLLGTGDIEGVGADGGRETATALPPLRVEWTGNATPAAPGVRAASQPRAQAEAPAAVAAASSSPDESIVVFSGTGGGLAYTARADDTLSELTAALYGTNSRSNRDAVVDANPSLQTDPDHVTIGRDYNSKAAYEVRPAPVAPTPAPAAAATPAAPAAVAGVPEMRYTAGRGDTVTALAEAFFGAGNRAARDAVTRANPSLGTNPDHLTAGTTYRIVAPDGLSAATAAPAAAVPTPASRRGPQPDADDLLRDGSGRTLRYTARAGDTVTNLAVALLGSDTKANRDAILNANATLKAEPDRVVVGETYWIPAPAARAPAGH